MPINRRACVQALFASSLPAWHLRAVSQAAAAEVVDETWFDSARQREVPVKTRWPDAARFGRERPVVIFSRGLGGTVERRQQVFAALPGGRKAHLVLKDADHMTFA